MSKNLDINNILIIGILILIVLLVCFKCINIQNKLTENFQDADLEAAAKLAAEAGNNNVTANEQKRLEDKIANMTPQEREELDKMCEFSKDKIFGSVVSKYSGKHINVTHVGKEAGNENYIIEWQPIGGKPGGCFTMEANGTYSTPLCNKGNIKQLWNIIKVVNQEQYEGMLKEGNKDKGIPLEDTKYPFHIIRSVSNPDYVLNYEGGSLSVREMANYNGQKWDARKDKIQQDPLPTQSNSKFVGLNPEHNISKSDMSVRSLGRSLGSVNGNGNGYEGVEEDSEEPQKKKGKKGKGGPVNLNINLDPDLLARLGLAVGSNGMLENLNENFNSGDMSAVGTRGGNSSSGSGAGGAGGKDDFLTYNTNVKNFTGGRGNVDEMIKKGSNNPSCDNCDDIPERYIKKDLVKSMCIGCDNIDNVLT